jgi:hypothetical protein
MVDVLIRSPRRTIRKDTAAYASLLSSLVKEQVPHAETQKQPRATSPIPCQDGQSLSLPLSTGIVKVFESFRDVVLGLSQVKTKHSRSQKRCRFCVDRAAGSKSRSPCWKTPPEEPATPPTIPPNLCRS